MIVYFFQFRLKQLWRAAHSTGLVYIPLALFLLSGVLLQGLSNLIDVGTGPLIVGASALLVAFFFNRTDYLFLKSTAQNLHLIYLIDAVLLCLPICIVLALLGKWLAILGFILCGLVLVFVWPQVEALRTKVAVRGRMKNISTPFLKTEDFELRLLCRQYAVPLISIYLVALFFIKYIAVSAILAFLILGFLQAILENYEPKELIFNTTSAKRFLWRKVGRFNLYTHAFLFPFYIFNLIFNSQYWFVILGIIISVMIMLCFFVFNKYVFYRPHLKKISSNILSGILLFFLLIPGMQILILLMTILQYYKAKKTLQYYWN